MTEHDIIWSKLLEIEVERDRLVRRLYELGTGKGRMMPVLSVDFDGVLSKYLKGWKGAGVIEDEPVDGALLFLGEAVKSFRVMISSSRSCEPGGIAAMRGWLLAKGLPSEILNVIEFPLVKPPAHVTIDDRAITFMGTFPSIQDLLRFVPWNKMYKLGGV